MISIELEGVKELMEALDPKIVEKALKKAIQRAATAGKTIISDQIRQKFNIKKADLDKKISIDLSRLNNLEGTLIVRGEPISLTYFGPTQVRGTIRTFQGRRNEAATICQRVLELTAIISAGNCGS